MYRCGTACWLAVVLLFSPSLVLAQDTEAAQAEQKAERLEESVVSGDIDAHDGEPITRSEAQAVDPDGGAPLDDPLTCLARTLYWEAKGQGANEMEAVANVVLNRLASKNFPDSVCAVVQDGSEQGSCQFSWWCDGRPDHVVEDGPYETAKEVARRTLNGDLDDRTRGALFFHHRGVSPGWSRTFTRTAETREFLFYAPAEGEM